MVRQYSVKAGGGWWPVAVFYNILDLASINAFVLYKKRTGNKVSRRGFLFKLATELLEDYIVERSSRNSTIARPHSLSTAHKKPKPRKLSNSCKLHSKRSKIVQVHCHGAFLLCRYESFPSPVFALPFTVFCG